jgi:hypothetical protein
LEGKALIIFRTLLCVMTFLVVSGCAGNRGGIVQSALNASLYEADTKAERLLRAYEVQALLVRFAAVSGGSAAARNAVALANIGATEQLDALVTCLRAGSVNSGATLSTALASLGPSEPVRADSAYCSFFESRLLDYEETLFSILRQVARDDPATKLLENLVTGPNILDFANVVSTLVQIAGPVVRDEMTLRAFTTDALELEYLVWQPEINGPNQIYSNCGASDPAFCGDRTTGMPEWAGIDALRSNLAGKNSTTARPNILVWHFEEVEAFMIAACFALNEDGLQYNAKDTNCSAKLPFPLPPTGTPIKLTVATNPPVVIPGPTKPDPSKAKLAAACAKLASANSELAVYQKMANANNADAIAGLPAAKDAVATDQTAVNQLIAQTGGKCSP